MMARVGRGLGATQAAPHLLANVTAPGPPLRSNRHGRHDLCRDVALGDQVVRGRPLTKGRHAPAGRPRWQQRQPARLLGVRLRLRTALLRLPPPRRWPWFAPVAPRLRTHRVAATAVNLPTWTGGSPSPARGLPLPGPGSLAQLFECHLLDQGPVSQICQRPLVFNLVVPRSSLCLCQHAPFPDPPLRRGFPM